eukprot:g40156.t1
MGVGGFEIVASAETVIRDGDKVVQEGEGGVGVGITVQQGLFHVSYEDAGIAQTHKAARSHPLSLGGVIIKGAVGGGVRVGTWPLRFRGQYTITMTPLIHWFDGEVGVGEEGAEGCLFRWGEFG